MYILRLLFTFLLIGAVGGTPGSVARLMAPDRPLLTFWLMCVSLMLTLTAVAPGDTCHSRKKSVQVCFAMARGLLDAILISLTLFACSPSGLMAAILGATLCGYCARVKSLDYWRSRAIWAIVCLSAVLMTHLVSFTGVWMSGVIVAWAYLCGDVARSRFSHTKLTTAYASVRSFEGGLHE